MFQDPLTFGSIGLKSELNFNLLKETWIVHLYKYRQIHFQFKGKNNHFNIHNINFNIYNTFTTYIETFTNFKEEILKFISKDSIKECEIQAILKREYLKCLTATRHMLLF